MVVTIRDAAGTLPATLRDYAQQAVMKLTSHFKGIDEATVVHEAVRESHTIEITVEGHGLVLRAEESNPDPRIAIDETVSHLETRLLRFKGKRFRAIAGRREANHHLDGELLLALEDIEPKGSVKSDSNETNKQFRIARRKHFELKPMSQEDAALNMEMLGHDFYLFREAESDQFQVIYQRKDGSYGIIIPSS